MNLRKNDDDYKSPWIEEPEATVDYLNNIFSIYVKSYKKEEFIFRQNEVVNHVFIIKSGRVRYSVYSEDGNETHRIIGKPGCFFGDVSFFDNNPENGNLSCIIDSTIFVIPTEFIKELLIHNKDFSSLMIQSICRKYRAFEHLLDEYTSKNAYSRVLTQLVNLANSHGIIENGKTKIDIVFTHTDLSYITFLSRVSVSYIMTDLSKRGLIEKKGSNVYINDMQALEQLLFEQIHT